MVLFQEDIKISNFVLEEQDKDKSYILSQVTAIIKVPRKRFVKLLKEGNMVLFQEDIQISNFVLEEQDKDKYKLSFSTHIQPTQQEKQDKCTEIEHPQ